MFFGALFSTISDNMTAWVWTRLVWRVAIVVAMLSAWFVTQAWLAPASDNIAVVAISSASYQIHDQSHVWTEPMHDWLSNHSFQLRLILTLSSTLIDAAGVYLLLGGIIGATTEPLLAVTLSFGFRQICQNICILPVPSTNLWQDPQILPSLLVTYDIGTDLFFSGHTVLSVLTALRVQRMCSWWMSVLTWLVAVFQVILVLTLRAHYWMDVFTAVFVAYAVDQWCRSLYDFMWPPTAQPFGLIQRTLRVSSKMQ